MVGGPLTGVLWPVIRMEEISIVLACDELEELRKPTARPSNPPVTKVAFVAT